MENKLNGFLGCRRFCHHGHDVPRWIPMSGKQNYINRHISTFYAQNIFCFDVFGDFEFQNFVFGAWIVFHEFAFFSGTGAAGRKIQIREKRFKHQKQNFKIQNRKKHENKKCFDRNLLWFDMFSRHSIDILLCEYPVR